MPNKDVSRTVLTGSARLRDMNKRINAELAEEFTNSMLLPGEMLLSNYRYSDRIKIEFRKRPRFAFGILCVLGSILFTAILIATLFYSSTHLDLSNPEDVATMYFVIALCIVLMIAGLLLLFLKSGPGKTILVFFTDKRIFISEARGKKERTQEVPVNEIAGYSVINKNRKGGKPPLIKVIITKNNRKKIILRPRRIDLDDTIAALSIIKPQSSQI